MVDRNLLREFDIDEGELIDAIDSDAADPMGDLLGQSQEFQIGSIVHGKVIEIVAKTRCVPFGAVRSESNLVGGGPETARAMVLGPDGDRIERNGKSEPMPAGMAAHEREQFGIYGHMLLAQSAISPHGRTLISSRNPYPRAVLRLDRSNIVTEGMDGNHMSMDRVSARQSLVKVNAAYPLWRGIQAAVVYQNLPGNNILASLVLPNAQVAPALGRNPALRHLMSRNFSPPRSAPKPASVTT